MEEEKLVNPESEKGRKLHALAEYEREHGDLATALKLCDEASEVYRDDGDFLGLAEVLSSKVLSLRHLARQNGSQAYLIQAEQIAKEAVKVAEMAGLEEASTLPFFNLAKIQEELGNVPDAVQSYREAAKRLLPLRHNLPAVRADIQVHLAACEYKTGDKNALNRAESWLKELSEADHSDKYSQDVWVSGGHMRIADAVKKDEPDVALVHMAKAKEIIDTDPQKFKLQGERWQELSKTT